MHDLASDASKNVVVLINDFNPEFGTALEKLSIRLNRPLQGVILLDERVEAAGNNKPDTTGKFKMVVCNFSDISSISAALKPFKDNLLLVVSSSERNQPYLKKALPHMPYVLGPTEHSLDWSTHKITMRELLQSYNPDLVPKFIQISHNKPEHIEHIAKTFNFPVIVKPNGLAASILVNKANNREELEEYVNKSFEVIEDIYKRDKGRGRPSMLIEEFMDGNMYSVDSYVNEEGSVWSPPVIKVTTANSIGKEGFYSYRNDTAHDLTPEQVVVAHDVAKQAIHALGLRSSVAHIELFLTKDGWKVIELGPRAGGYRQDMYLLGYGMDHAYNELLVKVGLEPEIINEPIGYCSIMNIYADTEGVITNISGFDDALTNPSVYWLKQYANVGDMALFCGNGGKFIVDGVLHNKELDQLNADVDLVRQTIKIEVK
jgi:biotin carboxylase